jgi:Fe2+ transport system protein FeoA
MGGGDMRYYVAVVVRTGQRNVRFKLFSLGFNDGVSTNVKAMPEGLNVIYRMHRG